VYKLLSIIRLAWFGGDSESFAGYHLWDPVAIINIIENIGVGKIVSNRSLAVTCDGKENYDGQFVASRILTNQILKLPLKLLSVNLLKILHSSKILLMYCTCRLALCCIYMIHYIPINLRLYSIIVQ
jgi:hypothetical protein